MEKPEGPREPEKKSGVERVREERQRRLEAEPGYKAGQSLGKQLRRGTLMVLPFEMVLGPVLLGLGGWWLDGYLGSSPLFTVLGVVGGLVIAVRAVIRAIKEVSR